jgi:DNA-binding MarR family transcriptional regulator
MQNPTKPQAARAPAGIPITQTQPSRGAVEDTGTPAAHPPRWLTEAEQGTWRGFLAAMRKVQEVLDRQLQNDAEMPVAYYMILVILSESDRRTLRMSDLAAATDSSPSRLSHAVARLEEMGWVQRESCNSDRRGSYAVLTDDGFAALAAAAPGHVNAVRQAVFDLLSPEQVDELDAICRALLDGDPPDQACPSLVAEPVQSPLRSPLARSTTSSTTTSAAGS